MADSTATTLHVKDEAFIELIQEYLLDHPDKVSVQRGQDPDDAIAELQNLNEVNVIPNGESRTGTHNQSERALRTENQFLEDLVAEISHDVQSPLTVVGAHIELARETGDLSHLDAAENALADVTGRLTYFQKLATEGEQRIDPTAIDLRAVVKDAWSLVNTAEADVRIHDGQPIMADPQRLRQLIENLIRNSIEHSGGDVTIHVGTLDGGFFVEDDGAGVPEAERSDVFEVGYSGDTGGTGMGLSIVQRIADAHGWTVELTEGETGGARFEFTNIR